MENNKYSYMKTIRFNGELENGNLLENKTKINININKFLKEVKINIKDIKEFLFIKDKNKLDGFLKIKKQFFKYYFKIEHTLNKGKISNSYKLDELKYMINFLDNLFLRNTEKSFNVIIKELSDSIKLNKRSDISFNLNKLNSRNYFKFINKLLDNLSHKNKNSKIESLKENINKIIEDLTKLQEDYLSSQSLGLCIAKGSLNYYTINKKPIEYFNNEIIKEKEKLENSQQYSYKKDIKKLQINESFLDFKNKFEFKIIEEYIEKNFKKNNENEIHFNIREIRDIMSYLKAQSKSKFYEDLNKLNLEKLKNKYYFFDKEEYIKKCIEFTKKIKENKEIKENKIKRGNFLIKKKKEDHFSKWCTFIKKYKNICQNYGKIKSQLKNIEIQKLEAENNKYWILICVEDEGDKFLWLVHRDKMTSFKKKILSLKKSDNSIKLSHINSLTKRAFHKLCFAEESTFVEDMPNDLKKKQKICKEATNDENELKKRIEKNKYQKKTNKIKLKGELELEFMKEVLKSEYCNNLLNIKTFNLEKVLEAKNNDQFEKEMNSLYELKNIYLSKNKKEDLIKKFNIIILKITSYDLEKRNENEFQTPKSEIKNHTMLWNNFWNNKLDEIRLNPEVKINFKKENYEEKEYLKSKNYSNRKIGDKYFITFSLTLNPNSIYTNTAFYEPIELIDKINKFNEEFNKKNWNDYYKFGIDRGNIELATLCIVKFNEEDRYEYGGKKILNPTFPNKKEDMKCFKLKKEYYNKELKPSSNMIKYKNVYEKNILCNLSYFTDNKELFEPETITTIDLTKAKVINGKIILNGDILTYLKLKKEGAKKLIWKVFKLCKNHKLEKGTENKKTIQIKLNGKEIYYFEKEFKGIRIKEIEYTFKNILDRLQDYLDKLKDWDKINNAKKDDIIKNSPLWHIPSENKINNLRKSIVSNMVGVISLLQERYPGFIILENLKKSVINKHFEEFYVNISRILENSLFQKFQTKGLVPSHINKIVEFRESLESKKKPEQYGNIIFIDETNTSNNCPFCEKKWSYTKEEKDKLKFIENKYICGKEKDSCGFDTKKIRGKFSRFKDINDPDKIAAYNIAKKIKSWKDIEKLKIPDGK